MLEKEDDKTRVYGFKKVNGGGCPYTGSWLAHVNLYRRVTWCDDLLSSRSIIFSYLAQEFHVNALITLLKLRQVFG